MHVLWEELKVIASTMSSEWLEAVDFYDIMCPMEEKKRVV